MSHDGPGGSAGGGAGVDALSLDLLAHALAGVRDPRDRKSCRLASRAFARAEAASRRAARPLRREALFARLAGRGQVWMTGTEPALFAAVGDAATRLTLG